MDYYDPSGYDCDLKQLYKNYTPVQYEGTVKVGGVERDVSRRVYQNNEINWEHVDKDTGLTNLQIAEGGMRHMDRTGKR